MTVKGNFYQLSLNGKNTPHFTIMTPNTLFDSRIEPETQKIMFFKKFLNIHSILSLSLSWIPNLIMQLYVFLIEIWLAKCRFKNLSLSKLIEENLLGGRLYPLRQEVLLMPLISF